MSKTFKSVWNVVSSALIGAVLILAILLSGVRIFGLQVFTVLSGSMEPLYHTGSLIYVKDVDDPTAVPDGTVITYMANEDTVVTHRVVGAVPDEEDPSVVRYRTKGDANDIEDGTLVHYKNIIGTPVFTIPGLGYVANFIQHPPGSYLTISFGAVFVLLLFLPELISALSDDKEEESASRKKPAKKKKQKQKISPRKTEPVPDDAWEAYPEEAPSAEYPEYSEYPESPEYSDYPDYPDYPARSYYPEEDYYSYYPEEEACPPPRSEKPSARRAGGEKSASRKAKRRGGAHCAK